MVCHHNWKANGGRHSCGARHYVIRLKLRVVAGQRHICQEPVEMPGFCQTLNAHQTASRCFKQKWITWANEEEPWDTVAISSWGCPYFATNQSICHNPWGAQWEIPELTAWCIGLQGAHQVCADCAANAWSPHWLKCWISLDIIGYHFAIFCMHLLMQSMCSILLIRVYCDCNLARLAEMIGWDHWHILAYDMELLRWPTIL